MTDTHAIDNFLSELDFAKHRAYGDMLRIQEVIASLVRGEARDSLGPDQVEAMAMELSIRVESEAVKSTLALVGLASALTEAQQIQLVRAPEAVYEAYLAGNCSFIDALSPKTEAYRYLVAPSPAVTAAHEYHCACLASFSSTGDPF